MKDKILIYGANGYSARLIIDELENRNVKPILAGRNADEIYKYSTLFKLPYKVFSLEDVKTIDENLSNIKTVLNCAGPFQFTAQPLIEACLRTGTNYLDITGEIPVFELALSKNKEAEEAGIVILPGVGFDVIPTDCLASKLHSKMPDAKSLKLGMKNVGGKISHGTWITSLEMMKSGGKVRKEGSLIDSPIGEKSVSFEKSNFKFSGISIPWGDVASAYYSTNIPDIEFYMAIPEMLLPAGRIASDISKLAGVNLINKAFKLLIDKTVVGPGETSRRSAKIYIWGKVENSSGESYEECYQVMEGYNLTSVGASVSAIKVNDGEVSPGAKTPSMAFGCDFMDQFVLSRVF